MSSICRIATKVALIGLFCVSVTCFSVAINAQDRNPGPATVSSDHDFEARSNTLRNLTAAKPGEHPEPEVRRDPKVVMEEARADYKFLQIDNKALKQTLAATTFAPASVVEWVADVRKRAERLNQSLALPELDKKTERMKIHSAANAEEFKTSVSNLSDLIRTFITNPCFREPALLVNEQTLKAKVDLEDLIALSKQVQKDSEKFAKSTTQP